MIRQPEPPNDVIVRVANILSEERSHISLHRHPFRTLYLFIRYISSCVRQISLYLLWNPLLYCVFLPLIACFLIFSVYRCPSFYSHIFRVLDTNHSGQITEESLERYYTHVLGWKAGASHQAASTFPKGLKALTASQFESWWSSTKDLYRQDAYFSHVWFREVEYCLADTIYWVVLGILSSAGFGTGIHSGVLFLFPHIYRACSAVATCGNTKFWAYPTNPFYGPSDRVFTCISPAMERIEGLSTPLLEYMLKVLPACVAWGFGTALGELPPYVLSYTAAKQGRKQHELEKASSYNVLNRMKEWTLCNIQKYGFFAVLLLAAWPNMAFDLCGMACGQFLMPFSTFFIATVIGKALIKVTLQAMFFVTLFSSNNVENLIIWLGNSVSYMLSERISVKEVIDKAVGAVVRARESIASRAGGHMTSEDEGAAAQGESRIAMIFNVLVLLAVGVFAKSIIESFAISVQEKEDKKLLASIKSRLKAELSTREASGLSDEELRCHVYAIKKRMYSNSSKSHLQNAKGLRTRQP